jgi:hypothetical protein
MENSSLSIGQQPNRLTNFKYFKNYLSSLYTSYVKHASFLLLYVKIKLASLKSYKSWGSTQQYLLKCCNGIYLSFLQGYRKKGGGFLQT